MNLNQVTIPARNLDVSIPFYQKLGLKLIVQDLPNYARFVCTDGNATFSLHRVSEEVGKKGAWIYFEEENLDEKVNRLQAQGIAFEQLPIDQPWLWREARLLDPDQNVIILYYAGENRLNPPWKIQS
jgi:catechol 2,3-dioxygenase-like lactoylglutathione lyase family enzyme